MSKINVRFNKTIFIPYNLPWAVVNKLGLDSENHVFNGLGINNEDIKAVVQNHGFSSVKDGRSTYENYVHDNKVALLGFTKKALYVFLHYDHKDIVFQADLDDVLSHVKTENPKFVEILQSYENEGPCGLDDAIEGLFLFLVDSLRGKCSNGIDCGWQYIKCSWLKEYMAPIGEDNDDMAKERISTSRQRAIDVGLNLDVNRHGWTQWASIPEAFDPEGNQHVRHAIND